MSEHGTVARYASGCRCSECRFANREYKRMNDHRPSRYERTRANVIAKRMQRIASESTAQVYFAGEGYKAVEI